MTSAGLLAKESAMAFVRGLVVQSEVVHAIILRETRTRFGKSRFGYMWALVDPVVIILTFFGFFSLLKRSAPLGMDIFSFMATGLIPYRLFASCAHQVGESINGNRALLYYPRVLPLDLAIARGLFELTTYSVVFLGLMGCHALYFQELAVESPLHVIAGLVLASLLGTTVGLVFCSLGVLSNSVDRARDPLLRPMFWVSGVFFTVATLPIEVQGLALLNPIIHCVELVRAGWFHSYGAEHVDLSYLLQWILGLALVGLILERAVRRRIQLT
jgi:capsular polysaccharide transport system permease protein